MLTIANPAMKFQTKVTWEHRRKKETHFALYINILKKNVISRHWSYTCSQVKKISIYFVPSNKGSEVTFTLSTFGLQMSFIAKAGNIQKPV